MLSPLPLKKGDQVAICATARKISQTEIQYAIKWLTDLGYKVILGNTIGLSHHQFAGTDAERAADFQTCFDDPKTKAIWCARGGYGSVRILNLLNFSAFKKQPKWIIGYSDITALHSHINNLGIATIHAPMPVDLESASAEAKQSLRKALVGDFSEIKWESAPENKQGSAFAETVGGNLSVLYSLCGSNSALQTQGKILFLEDVDEYYYHIDRMLQNLARNGMFKNLAGLVIGAMSSMHDNPIPFGISIEKMILDLVKAYEFPVVFNAPFGHIADNRAVIFGKNTRLLAGENNVSISAQAEENN